MPKNVAAFFAANKVKTSGLMDDSFFNCKSGSFSAMAKDNLYQS